MTKADSHVLAVAVFCTIFGFGAGVMWAINAWPLGVLFLAAAIATGASSLYAMHR